MISPIRRIAGLKRRVLIAWSKIRSEMVLAEFLGCHLFVRANEDVGKSILAGDFEIDDIRYFEKHIQANDVVLDIGANIGAYCITSGKHYVGARIFAFEPIPMNAQLIRASILLNGISNVQVIQKCVADYCGKTEFSISTDSAYSSMMDTMRRPEQQVIQAEVIRLDDFCAENQIEQIGLIKVDVEGAEERVINGAKELLTGAKPPRLIMMELYDNNLKIFGSSISKVIEKMASYGYSPYVLVNKTKVTFEDKHHNEYYNVFFEKVGSIR